MNNKKKKELSKFQKTLAIIGLILCAAGAIFGFTGMRMSVFFPPMNTAVRYILSTLLSLISLPASTSGRIRNSATTIACKNTLASRFHNISHGSYRPTCYRALR